MKVLGGTVAAGLALGCTLLFPATAPAAGTGVAYDSVTRFLQAGAAPDPGTFDADFEKASTLPPQHGGMFGKLISAAANAGAMFTNGNAERHYIGTTKERTDEVALNTADITDCKAQTITHLDLNAKTYSVTSMFQPETSASSGGGHPSQPQPMPTDDGTKVAIDMKTAALGPKTIEAVPTNGYDMDMNVTATKPSGETSTFTSHMTSYYSKGDEPQFVCDPYGGVHVASGQASGASAAQMLLITRALAARKGDSRFTVTNSGPPVPSGKFSMWELMTLGGSAHNQSGRSGGSFSILIERGNVRSINDGDAVFSVPPDFRKV